MEPVRREIVLPRAVYVALGIVLAAALLYWLRAVLTPVFLAFTIAYVLDPVVDRFEAWKFPRPLGIAVVLGVALGAITLFLALAVPAIAGDLAKVAEELPRQVMALLERAEPWLERHGVTVPKSATEWIERFGSSASAVTGSLVSSAGGVLGSLIGGTFSLIGSAAAALIVPVFAVYLLNDFDRITAAVHGLLPLGWREPVASYAREVDAVLSQFMRGQLTVMAILAVLYGAAYSVAGVRLAIPIGIVAGVLNFIPYLGGAFALGAGLLMCALGGGGLGQFLAVVAAYVTIQTIEGFVLTPRIVGKTVGLSEAWVLFALFLGGELFGFLGVLLAVPLTAVAKIFVTRGLSRYRATALYLGGVEPRGVAGEQDASGGDSRPGAGEHNERVARRESERV
jgi:predicted PurR-regulated permease PerM